MADLPWYSTDLARNSALEAQRLADLATTGQHLNAGHFVPDAASQGGQKWVVDPGATVRTLADGTTKYTGGTVENAPSSLGLLGNAATTPNTQLNPNNNQYLRQAGDAGMIMARGGAGQVFGLNEARGAAGDAAAAAGQIGSAGAMNQAGQSAQLGQTGQDLGVVRASAQGMGPSAAQHLAQSQLDSNIRAQSSMAATARGGNIASAMRGAQNAGQNMMLQSQQQMAAQRAQEQLNSQGLLTQGNAGLNNSLYGARAQDLGQATAGAQASLGVGGLQNQIFGTNSDLGKFGVGAQNNTAALYGTQMGQQTQADQNSRQAYADWLQRQQQISMGIPVQVGGQMGQIAIANDQASQQREAAVWNAASSGIAALGQFGH